LSCQSLSLTGPFPNLARLLPDAWCPRERVGGRHEAPRAVNTYNSRGLVPLRSAAACGNVDLAVALVNSRAGATSSR
jgi:hypothetical protein